MSAIELSRSGRLPDKTGLARLTALAMLAGASAFILAVILT